MLKEKINLYSESLFAPYKKDETFHQVKKSFLSQIEEEVLNLKSKDLSDDEIYDYIKQKIDAGLIAVNLNQLEIDGTATLKYNRHIFMNENLEDNTFVNTEYDTCDFKDAQIPNKYIYHTVLKRNFFKKTRFLECNIEQSDFLKSDLSQAVFEDCKIDKSLFSKSHLPKTSFDKSAILNTVFEECYLKSTSFKNTRLINVQFRMCDLKNVDFSESIMDNITYNYLKDEKVSLESITLL